MVAVNASEPIGAKEYVRLRDRVGFSGRGMARFVGVNEKTERNWSAGQVAVPGPVFTLLRLLIKLKIPAARAAELVPATD